MPVMKQLSPLGVAMIGFGRNATRAGLGSGVHVYPAPFKPGRNLGYQRGNVSLGRPGKLGHLGAAPDPLPGITFGGNSTAAQDFVTGFTLDSNYGSWPGFMKSVAAYQNATQALADNTNPWVISQLPRLDSLSKISGQNQPCGGWNGDPNCVFGNTCGCRGQAHSAAYLASTKALAAALTTFGTQYQQQLAAAGGAAVTTGSNTFSPGGAVAPTGGGPFVPGANTAAGAAGSSDVWKYVAIGAAGLVGVFALVFALKPKKRAALPAPAPTPAPAA